MHVLKKQIKCHFVKLIAIKLDKKLLTRIWVIIEVNMSLHVASLQPLHKYFLSINITIKWWTKSPQLLNIQSLNTYKFIVIVLHCIQQKSNDSNPIQFNVYLQLNDININVELENSKQKWRHTKGLNL